MGKKIGSTGPVPCDVMVVAERPGLEESKRGIVLCGPSGQELDRYLRNEAGIDRARVYCTNLVRDFRGGENPEEWEVARDWPLLVQEVQLVHPKFVLALGLWSARALLGLDIELDWANGLHFPLKWECCHFTVMPVIHTAAGLHQPNLAGKIAYGFRQFGALLRGDALPTGHWRDDIKTAYSESKRKHWDVTCLSGVDTEGSVDNPWCVSCSLVAGHGVVFRASVEFSGRMVLHNAIHDLPVLDALGVKYGPITDTMLMAALLGTEPLGLKALARRHCGMVSLEYSDIVRDARREKALEYLGKVLGRIEVKP
jgi:uracil-DNA glycosylase family 4